MVSDDVFVGMSVDFLDSCFTNLSVVLASVFLGAGGLGAKDDAYVDAYWKESVQTVGAKRVIPVHWDNFYLPLDVALVPAPGFDKTMAALLARGQRDGVEVRLQTEWRWVDPSAK